MKKHLLFFLSFIVSFQSFSQTWSDDIAQIFYDKCAKCHHATGVAPFELMTYSQVNTMASAIYDAVAQDKMPPWPPNDNYQQYAHSRSLSSLEKSTILNWLTSGTPEGNSANTPPPPVFNSGSVLGGGDLQVQIPNYISKATAQNDDYVCFVIPNGLTQSRIIKSIEIVPGNRSIVHHCLVYVDGTNATITDTIGGDCGSPSSSSATLLMGYTPGSSPMTLPSSGPLKLGMNMPSNASIVFAMHYPAGSFGQLDSTKVIFHFYPPGETGVREISAAPVLSNWSFNLPPNQHTNVSAVYPSSGGITGDASILSVFPHMHLLGESMKVYGLKPNLDTIPLIHVPHWDFHWQDFYFFKNLQHIPVGSKLKVDARYDNTDVNIHNPNSPPITVHPGLNTSDEMCLVYAHFMAYVNGDENYDIESLMDNETSSLIDLAQENSSIKTYPNPFDESITVEIDNLELGDQIKVFVYDFAGRLIQSVFSAESYGNQAIVWNGETLKGDRASSGMYFLSINHNGVFSNKEIVKR